GLRFPGDSPSQKRLTRGGRTHDQDAPRDSQPGLSPALGRTEIIDDVAKEFGSGALPADVGEFRLVRFGDRPILRFAEFKDVVELPALHLPSEIYQAKEYAKRDDRDRYDGGQCGIVACLLIFDLQVIESLPDIGGNGRRYGESGAGRRDE